MVTEFSLKKSFFFVSKKPKLTPFFSRFAGKKAECAVLISMGVNLYAFVSARAPAMLIWAPTMFSGHTPGLTRHW